MIQTWPSTLPRPERPTFQMQAQDARRKRNFENGPPGYRRRYSAVAQMVSLSFILSASQRAVFDDFYNIDCAGGAELFLMPDPTREGWPLLEAEGGQLTDETGKPLLVAALWLCAWGDTPPVESVQGIEFKKTIQIVVMP